MIAEHYKHWKMLFDENTYRNDLQYKLVTRKKFGGLSQYFKIPNRCLYEEDFSGLYFFAAWFSIEILYCALLRVNNW